MQHLKKRLLAGVWFSIAAFLVVFLGFNFASTANFDFMAYFFIFFATSLGFILGFLFGYLILLLPSSRKGIIQAAGFGILGSLLAYIIICFGFSIFMVILQYKDCATRHAVSACSDVATFSTMIISFLEGSLAALGFGLFFAIFAINIGIFFSVLLYFLRD